MLNKSHWICGQGGRPSTWERKLGTFASLRRIARGLLQAKKMKQISWMNSGTVTVDTELPPWKLHCQEEDKSLDSLNKRQTHPLAHSLLPCCLWRPCVTDEEIAKDWATGKFWTHSNQKWSQIKCTVNLRCFQQCGPMLPTQPHGSLGSEHTAQALGTLHAAQHEPTLPETPWLRVKTSCVMDCSALQHNTYKDNHLIIRKSNLWVFLYCHALAWFKIIYLWDVLD